MVTSDQQISFNFIIGDLIMAILFNSEAIESLTTEERATLTKLADKAQAPTVEEASRESKEAMENYCKQLQEKAQADAARQKALQESFV